MNTVRDKHVLEEKPASMEIPRKRGRPKDQELRERILANARDLFLEHGFPAVSVDSIATAAGVSNRTVFSHFPSKDQLLWAVIVAEGETLRPAIPDRTPETPEQFRAGLCSFGVGLVSLLTSPKIVRLGTLMLSEAGRHPELAKAFFQWGPLMTRQTLEQWIELGKKQGWLAQDTPRHAGDHLLALWQGTWHLAQQLGIEPALSPRKVQTHVQECVDLFLKAFGGDR